MADLRVCVPDAEELSGIGAAYLAGITMKLFDGDTAFGNLSYHEFRPEMEEAEKTRRYEGWKEAVSKVL